MSEPTTGVPDAPALSRDRGPDFKGEETTAAPEARQFASLPGMLRTALVLAAIAAFGYWGHHTGWRLARFSELAGAHPAKPDWCATHDVPESICVECNPKLLPEEKDYGFCKEHGVHQCPHCHPDSAQVTEPAVVAKADRDRIAPALAVMERPENNPRCPLYRRRIQFASAEAMTKAAVDVDLVEERPMLETIAATGEMTYDETRVARLSSPAPGTIRRVEVRIGDRVKQGEVIALVDAAEVGRAKAQFLQALVQTGLKRRVLEDMRQASDALSGRRMQEVEAALQEAEIELLTARQTLVNLGLPIQPEELSGLRAAEVAERIQFLGLPASLAAQLDPKTTTSNLLPIKSPHDGTIVALEAAAGVHDKNPVAGEIVDAAKLLFVVADVSRLWLTLDVRQEDVKHVAISQPVLFRPTGAGRDAAGKVVWISTEVDEATRTVKVRADIPNTDGRLRAGTFASGRLVLRDEPKAVAVPSEAIHWDGSCHVVFVRDKRFFEEGAYKLFRTRTVRPGARDDTHTEIIAGLLPGEVVASKGSGVLRSALLKNNLGAG